LRSAHRIPYSGRKKTKRTGNKGSQLGMREGSTYLLVRSKKNRGRKRERVGGGWAKGKLKAKAGGGARPIQAKSRVRKWNY